MVASCPPGLSSIGGCGENLNLGKVSSALSGQRYPLQPSLLLAGTRRRAAASGAFADGYLLARTTSRDSRSADASNSAQDTWMTAATTLTITLTRTHNPARADQT